MFNTFIADTEPKPLNDYGTPPSLEFEVSDVTIGPIGVNDNSKGLTYQYWAAYYDAGIIKIDDLSGNSSFVISEPDGVKSISLAFDQNANPVYLWITNPGNLKLRWFDASINSYVVDELGTAQSAVMTMDMKYDPSNERSDILLFYIRDGAILYRVQRDKYEIENISPVTSGAISLSSVGTTTGYRTQVVYSSANTEDPIIGDDPRWYLDFSKSIESKAKIPIIPTFSSEGDFKITGKFTFSPNTVVLASDSNENNYIYLGANFITYVYLNGAQSTVQSLQDGDIVDFEMERIGSSVSLKFNEEELSFVESGVMSFGLFGESLQFANLFLYQGSLFGKWVFSNSLEERVYDFNFSGDQSTGSGQPIVIDTATESSINLQALGMNEDGSSWVPV